MHVNIVNFLKLMLGTGKNVPLERWIQTIIGGFKTVNLPWVNKTAGIGYSWLFVNGCAHSYEEGMHVTPDLLLHLCMVH